MEADNLSLTTRNHILCEVFNMLPDEDEDELPFRVIEDETEKAPAPVPAESDSEMNDFQEIIDD
jgi:hypothetical protein